MKTKKKCITCSNHFEAKRNDAIYCSNACKQRSYATRKINTSNKEDTAAAHSYFYLDEYQSTCDQFGYDSETLPLILFCFLRKNLCEDADIETVSLYINSMWTCNNLSELIQTNAYNNFKETFLSDGIKILPNKN